VNRKTADGRNDTVRVKSILNRCGIQEEPHSTNFHFLQTSTLYIQSISVPKVITLNPTNLLVKI
jgi:hypothetical protein